MNGPIVHSSDPVTLLGGGDASVEDVRAALTIAPTCVAADGGAELARRAGVALDGLIGDFDSISSETLAVTPPDRRFHITEQDSTDFDKALRHIAAPVVVAVGFTGARIDHQLGVLHVLARRADRPCVVLGDTEIIFVCPPQLRLETAPGDVVSLFPMGQVSGTSTGLRWAIDGLAFHPMTRTGTSNEALGAIELTMHGPAMIVIVPRRYLTDVTQVLARAPSSARWPARAERYTGPTQS